MHDPNWKRVDGGVRSVRLNWRGPAESGMANTASVVSTARGMLLAICRRRGMRVLLYPSSSPLPLAFLRPCCAAAVARRVCSAALLDSPRRRPAKQHDAHCAHLYACSHRDGSTATASAQMRVLPRCSCRSIDSKHDDKSQSLPVRVVHLSHARRPASLCAQRPEPGPWVIEWFEVTAGTW
jgi:hypothetical protein